MHNVFIQLWNTWILVFCVNDLYIYDLLLQGGTWDTRGCFYIGFQFLWACEYDFLLWLCISLGPFSKFGDECIWLGSFSKKIDLYVDNSYYMECIDEIRWKWMPNFWNNYYEHMLLLLLQANGLHITIFSLGEIL
jgi:hypothetical protein